MADFIPSPPSDETGARDTVEVAVAGALNLVPILGGWLSSGVQKVFAQQEHARLNTWMIEFVETVNELISVVDGLTVEGLADTPEFYDMAVRAARIALTSSSEEKHRALKNGLFHTGSQVSQEQDLHAVFLRYVDELTPTHLRLLAEFIPIAPQYLSADRLSDSNAAPDRRPIYLTDLTSRGLLEERSIFNRNDRGMTITASSMAGGYRITSVGQAFVAFINGPFGDVR